MSDQKILAPDGREVTSRPDATTERQIERIEEDEKFVPVILKRNDESVRHPDDTLERAIAEGIEQHKRSTFSLFLSSLAAGLILGFAAMCVAYVSQLMTTTGLHEFVRLAMAIVYPLGFVICIMSGTQLFTEHTATAVYPVLDGKAGFKSLMRLWSIVLIGNLCGALLCSALLYTAEPVIASSSGFLEVAEHLIHYSPKEIFFSAILAGWLMAQGGWLVLATPPASSQVLCIYVVTFIIGLGGLHHSIAGAAEVFSGLLHSPNPKFLESFEFLFFAIIGNLVGGSCFVGMLNYGHIRSLR